MAAESGPFEDVFPIEKRGFQLAMLVHQKVHPSFQWENRKIFSKKTPNQSTQRLQFVKRDSG